jgi:hypothetical protein
MFNKHLQGKLEGLTIPKRNDHQHQRKRKLWHKCRIVS